MFIFSKNSRLMFFGALIIASYVTSPAQANSDVLENIAAVAASRNVCNFKVNEQIYEMAINTLAGGSENVSPGGRHWPDIKRNMERIKILTQTSEGRQSFCRRVGRDLSSFFD